VITWQGILLGLAVGVTLEYLRENLVSGPARDRDRRADERRVALRVMAEKYDGAALNIAVVGFGMRQDPATYQGPSVPNVWYAAFQQIATSTLIWSRDWRFVLGRRRKGRELGRRISDIHKQSLRAQEWLDDRTRGWHSPASLQEIERLSEMVEALPVEARRRAATRQA
jgi:hypothetical protein